MSSLEQMRAAALGPQKKRSAIHLFCSRCEREMAGTRIARECHACQLAGVQAFGSVHPRMEMSG